MVVFAFTMFCFNMVMVFSSVKLQYTESQDVPSILLALFSLTKAKYNEYKYNIQNIIL